MSSLRVLGDGEAQVSVVYYAHHLSRSVPHGAAADPGPALEDQIVAWGDLLGLPGHRR